MSIDYLVEKYSKLVYKICYDMLKNALDAEDITQEVYVSLYLNFDRYGILEENEIKNIICKIALNKCKDVLKSKAKKLENMTMDGVLVLENFIDHDSVEQEVIKIENKKMIQELINSLKHPYKEILNDYYIEEYSLDNIASKMNVTKGTLKMQLYRGKKILKEKLEEFKGGDYYD
ncbi:MAG: sigma-70 family RNA polymerase sigma factor [Clostridia bacterium]|nr:sigma-70 family RNA polymerase sigma factor [Clostridia bacterium]